MTPEKKTDPYDIPNYDLVYVILKDASKLTAEEKVFLKFDSKKKRYYYAGKLVKSMSAKAFEAYPKQYNIALVPPENWEKYKKEPTHEKRLKHIINIHFRFIEYITLDFDSLDWID